MSALSTAARPADSIQAPHVSDDDEAGQVAPYFQWKAWLDRCAALMMILPIAPLIAVLVVVVRISSPGPGIYRQKRMGRNGREFIMYKLRTMRQDAEARSGAVWCGADDPRITTLGRWLRKSHLDELPQLFNVLRGEMSLVGPRPERPEFVTVLSEQIRAYPRRLAISPGITGLAQINLPPDTDLNSVRRKLVLDLEYLRQGGLLLDLRIVAATALRLIGLGGPTAVGLLGLHRSVVRTDEESSGWEPPAHGDDDRRMMETVCGKVGETIVMPRFLGEMTDEDRAECEASAADCADFDNVHSAVSESPPPRKPR